MRNPNIQNLIIVVNEVARDSKDELISKYGTDPGQITPRAQQIALGKAMKLLKEAIDNDSDKIQDYAKYTWIVLNAVKFNLDYKKAAEDFKIEK